MLFRLFLKAVSYISFFLVVFIILNPWEFCFEILNYFLLPIPPQKNPQDVVFCLLAEEVAEGLTLI